jgi:Domain of unknown function (DUF4890)
MKKYILLVFVALLATATQAQSTEPSKGAKKEMKSPAERAEFRTQKMTEKYKLDADQSARLLELHKEKMAKDEKIRQQAKETQTVRKDLHNKRKAEQDAYLKSLSEIMSPDQFSAFETDFAERKTKQKERRQAAKNSGQ